MAWDRSSPDSVQVRVSWFWKRSDVLNNYVRFAKLINSHPSGSRNMTGMDSYEHFRSGETYRLIGCGFFTPKTNGDPMCALAFDADNVKREVYVYMGKDCFFLEVACGNFSWPVSDESYIVYEGQYCSRVLGNKPWFVRRESDFFA